MSEREITVAEANELLDDNHMKFMPMDTMDVHR